MQFGNYTKALRACGFDGQGSGFMLSMEELFKEWAGIVRDSGEVPSIAEYQLRSQHSCGPLTQEVWLMATCPGRAVAVCGEKRAGRAMGRCAGDHETAWAARGGRGYISRPLEGVEFRPKNPERPPVYGEPFLRTALSFAPVNEMGVVYLFGAMAEKLGFIVTWIGTQYPDVEAFREVAPGRWQRVRIEIEFMSRNFLQHFHDPKECDLILCWENNWPDCPVEVGGAERSTQPSAVSSQPEGNRVIAVIAEIARNRRNRKSESFTAELRR
jgi:hypothetical protein